MNEFLERISKLSPQRLTLLALELQAEVEALRRASREPIAVIGMGCRFPGGADDPSKFWRLLRDGVDAVVEVPGDRWDCDAYYDADPSVPGKMSTRRGGFLERVEAFDPQFFGILPGEARAMDPQQRLVLEVAWEAIEDAGIAADRLAGSRTGVFVGIGGQDFAQLLNARGPDALHGHVASGISPSIAAGRLSYVLGLSGPSVSLDTSCSSSLVAISLACDSLRAGRCGMAMAGGVNVILTPTTSIILSKAGMMAPDGRCKTFDAAADGFVRGEGCGIVVLKRLSDARADGDRILAVIRGTAVNQDGRSAGLTAPNGPAQQALLREAMADAGLRSDQVQYVEAHGTGTPLGDPIEVQALAAVLGEGRTPENPLMIGSAKTNIGHLECAAGVAGFLKAVLALQHSEIPPHLHLETPNPHINWAGMPIAIPTRTTPWPAGPGPRIAGVSSFGFSGTNAHILLEQAPEETPRAEGPDRPIHLLCLSARSEGALEQLARRYARHLADDPSISPADVCYTANTGRSHFAHRLTVLGEDREQLLRGLGGFAMGSREPGVAAGRVDGEHPITDGLVFVFTGAGRLDGAAGRQLYQTQPTFRQAYERCRTDARGEALPDRGDLDGPALFALQHAMAELLRSWGLAPAAELGHGRGEIATACANGEPGREHGLERVDIPEEPHRRAVSDPDRWLAGIRTLYDQGHRVFLEIGHDPGLREMAREVLPEGSYLWLSTLLPGHDDWRTLLETVAALHLHGVGVDWSGFDRDYPRRKVALPLYPFERSRYWPESVSPPPRRPAPAPGPDWRDWLYEPRWEPQPESHGTSSTPHHRNGSTPNGRGTAAGRWLILADAGSWGHRLAQTLTEAGGECTLIHPAPAGSSSIGSETRLAADHGEDDVESLRSFLRADRRPCRGVIDLRALDEAIAEDSDVVHLKATQQRSCGGLLHLAQALARSGDHPAPPLTVVTIGAQSVGDDPGPPRLAQTTLWGLGRVIALEHPDLACMRIDLDPRGGPDQARALRDEILRSDRSDEEVAFRQGRRLVPRLARYEARHESGSFDVARGDGTYLVTGGLTGLGLATARWLVDQKARHLVLAGRSAPSREAGLAIAEMERAGARVLVIQADVSRREDVNRILRLIDGTGAPLRGLIHAAGTFDDGVLLEQRWERFEGVMAAKVAGAWNLHQATRGLPLDFFALYSSGASLLGSPGQGNYAAANAFLDGLAHYRRALGRPGLAINWGPWAEIGRTASMGSRHAARRTAMGIGWIEPARGFEALRLLLSQARPQIAVLPSDPSRSGVRMPTPDPLPSLLRKTADREQPAESTSSAGPAGLLMRLRSATMADRRALLVDLVHQAVSQLFLADRGQPIAVEENLLGLGMDSLMAIQLSNQLNRSVGLHLPTTIAFDHPTIAALADLLLSSLPSRDSNGCHVGPDVPAATMVPADSGSVTDWSPQRARDALQDLGRLSDTDVDALLNDILAAQGDE